jgi:hypothetical protein
VRLFPADHGVHAIDQPAAPLPDQVEGEAVPRPRPLLPRAS